MKLYLHIGTEKTGTTTIQAFLDQNRELFSHYNTLIPVSLGAIGHRKLPSIFFPQNYVDDFIKHEGLLDPIKRAAETQRWKQEFLTELAAKKTKKVIISSEHLHSRLREPKTIAALADFLNGIFEVVQVVLYIRSPIDTAVSLFSTSIKSGGTLEAPPFPSDPYWNNIVNHRQTILKWSSIFGMENMRVRIFSKEFFVGNSLIDDFLTTCGETHRNFTVPKNVNSKLDRLGLELLRRVNVKVPTFLPNGRPNLKRRDILTHFERHFSSGPTYIPSLDLIEEYHNTFAESNEWVRKTFFPGHTTIFSPASYLRRENIDFDNDELDKLSDFIASIWLNE